MSTTSLPPATRRLCLWILLAASLLAALAGCGASAVSVTAPPPVATTTRPPASAPLAGMRAPASVPIEDPYLWLEDITGEKAITWVKRQNAKTQAELEADPRFRSTRERLLRILIDAAVI